MQVLDRKHSKELKRTKRRRQSLCDNGTSKATCPLGAHGKLTKPKIGILKPWERDGHESPLHYLVEHKSAVLKWVLKEDFTDHPLYTRALNAQRKKLI